MSGRRTNQQGVGAFKAGEPFVGKQGLQYAIGISAESVGAKAIHLQVLTIPPGGPAFARSAVQAESQSTHWILDFEAMERLTRIG